MITQKEIEERAAKICERLGIDAEAILDTYGPVKNKDIPHYHLNEIAIAAEQRATKAVLERLRNLRSEDREQIAKVYRVSYETASLMAKRFADALEQQS
ncbi:MAG: hypothetical protein ACRCVX_12595 [Shewanella sp.]